MEQSSRTKKLLLVILFWTIVLSATGITLRWWYVVRPEKQKQEEQKKQQEHEKEIQGTTGSESRYKDEVRLRLDSFSGYCILRSPEMKNQLKKQGIKLVIEDDKADYVNRLEALKNNEADIAVFTVDSLLSAGAKLKDFPATIIMVIDESRGADAIVAYKTGVKNIQDLNNPNSQIVLTENSPSEFLARIVVSDFNLPDLREKWISPANGSSDVYEKLRKASKTEPMAYVLWEPHVSKALKDPDVHVLLASDKLKGYIVDVLVASRKFVKEKPELAQKIIESYFRASYYYNEKTLPELIKSDAKPSGENLSNEEANQLVEKIHWKNTLENYAYFGLLSSQESKGIENLEDIITKIKNVLVTTRAVSEEEILIPPNMLFYDKILTEMQASNFHPSQKIGLVQGEIPLDKIRVNEELPVLTDEEWGKLIPVGQMKIKTLSFGRGTSDLNIQSKRDLEELSDKLKSMPMYYLLVTGHSRAQGDVDANLELAKNRAEIVAEYLTLRMGISKNRVRALGAKPSGESGLSQSVTFQLGQTPY